MSSWPRSLHLSAAPRGSGSDIAASRLLQALKGRGAEADWLSPWGGSQGSAMIPSADSLYWTGSANLSRWIARGVDRLDRRRFGIHLSVTPGMRSRPLRRWPADLIHLHWIGTGFLSLFSLKGLRKPLIWTLHDLWPLLGVLPYPSEHVPIPTSQWGLDLDPLARALKRHCLPAGIQFIAPSPWAARTAAATPVFASLTACPPIAVIPNAVNDIFLAAGRVRRPQPLDKPALLLFGGSNAFSDPRKGWQLMEPLLPWLANYSPDWKFASFGEIPGPTLRFPMRWEHHGPIRNPRDLADLYCQASLIVVPSRQETFGQVAAEAQACGVPVVALADSGVGAVVEHLQSGFLMTQFSTSSLQEALSYFLDEPKRLQVASQKARDIANQRFTPLLIAEKHLQLYTRMCAGDCK